jgi:hypothetical protein
LPVQRAHGERPMNRKGRIELLAAFPGMTLHDAISLC